MSVLKTLFEGHEDLLARLPELNDHDVLVLQWLQVYGIEMSTLDLQVGQLEAAITLAIADHLNTATAFGFDTSRIMNVARRVHQAELVARDTRSDLEQPLGESHVEDRQEQAEEIHTGVGDKASPIILASR